MRSDRRRRSPPMRMSFYQAVVDAGDGGKDFSVVFRWLAAQPRQ